MAQSCPGMERGQKLPWVVAPHHLSLLPSPLLCKATAQAPPGLLPALDLGSPGLSVFPEEASSGSRELPPFPVFPELAGSTDEVTGRPSSLGLREGAGPTVTLGKPQPCHTSVSPTTNWDVCLPSPPGPCQGPKNQPPPPTPLPASFPPLVLEPSRGKS